MENNNAYDYSTANTFSYDAPKVIVLTAKDFLNDFEADIDEYTNRNPNVTDDTENCNGAETVTYIDNSSNEEVAGAEVSQLLDNELSSILKSWGLPKNVYSLLKEHGISSLDLLKKMDNHHFDQIFTQKTDFAHKVIIEHNLKISSNSCGNLKGSSSSSTFPLPDNSTSSHSSSDIILLSEILECTDEGNRILSYYKQNGRLSSPFRQFLVDVITKYFINKNLKMPVATIDNISDQIVQLFEYETKAYYYAPQKNAAPKGKLFNKYQNIYRKLCENGLIDKNQRLTISKIVNNSTSETEPEPEPDAELTRVWLQNHNSPWEDIKKAWSSTKIFRESDLNTENENLSNVLVRWPLYKHSHGYFLIDVDFLHKHSTATDIFNTWHIFIGKIFDIYEEKIKDFASKELLKEYKELNTQETEDLTNIIAMWLLPSILQPTTKVSSKNTKGKATIKRFTIIDSQKSIISLVKHSSKIDDLIKTKHQEGVAVQPFIIVVGADILHPLEYYVYMDGIKYKFFSFLKSLDTCFKSFQVFNLQYPVESIAIWQFLQNHLYNFKTKYDKVLPHGIALANDLNSNK